METVIKKAGEIEYRRYLLLTFLLFLLFSIIVRSPTLFFDFFSNDEAAHFMGSVIISKGGELYRDFVDNKPPVIYLFYLISRELISDDIFSVHLLTTLLLVPSIAFFLSLLSAKFNRCSSILSGLFYIISSSSYIPTDMLSTNCEIPMLFFSSIAFLFLIKMTPFSLFTGGIFLGLATLSKQQAAVWILSPLIPLLILFKKKRDTKCLLSSLMSLWLGFAIPVALVTLYFHTEGRLEEFLYFNINHNITYMKNPITLYEITKRTIKYLLPFLIIISPLFYLYIKGREEIPVEIRRLIEISLFLSVIPCFAGFRLFPHYFIQILLPLSILASFFPFAKNRKILRLIALYLAILPISFNIYTFRSYSRETDFIEETLTDFREIPRSLMERGVCIEGDKVFIWGYAPLFYYYFYKYCELLPASRFVVPQASISGYIPGNESSLREDFDSARYIVEGHRDGLIRDLKENTPQIIIDTAPSGFHNWGRYPIKTFPELNELITHNYLFFTNKNGFHIYLRK